MDRAFLVFAAAFGLLGVAAGAFGSHALRSRLTPERLAWFDTAVRYQLWHALALSIAVFLRGAVTASTTTGFLVARNENVFGAIAGWSFVAGIVVFCGSLYALALSGVRRWGAVTPVGGLLLLLGWGSLIGAALTV